MSWGASLTSTRCVGGNENMFLVTTRILEQLALGSVGVAVVATNRRQLSVRRAFDITRADQVIRALSTIIARLVSAFFYLSAKGEVHYMKERHKRKHCQSCQLNYAQIACQRHLWQQKNTSKFVNLHPSQPIGETFIPSGQVSHLGPRMPGLQTQRPEVCSQSLRTEPKGEQLQAKRNRRNLKILWEHEHERSWVVHDPKMTMTYST